MFSHPSLIVDVEDGLVITVEQIVVIRELEIAKGVPALQLLLLPHQENAEKNYLACKVSLTPYIISACRWQSEHFDGTHVAQGQARGSASVGRPPVLGNNGCCRLAGH